MAINEKTSNETENNEDEVDFLGYKILKNDDTEDDDNSDTKSVSKASQTTLANSSTRSEIQTTVKQTSTTTTPCKSIKNKEQTSAILNSQNKQSKKKKMPHLVEAKASPTSIVKKMPDINSIISIGKYIYNLKHWNFLNII